MLLSPLPTGWASATEVRFYDTWERNTTPTVVVATEGPAGVWSADESVVPAGRWYPTVVGLDAGGAEVTYEDDYADLPEDPSLVVSAESVAVKAKIPLPLTPEQRETITDAIRDAQADVVAYLGREITPTLGTEYQRWAWAGDEWNLVGLGDEPLIRVVSAVPETDPVTGVPSDYFTVTYLYGIDARTDERLHPIRRYVRLHAMNSPDVVGLWKVVTGAKGEVRSVSAEGQSVSFAAPTLSGSATTGTKPGDLTPGSLPTLASLDRWRLAGRRVHQGPTRSSDWPFHGARWGTSL